MDADMEAEFLEDSIQVEEIEESGLLEDERIEVTEVVTEPLDSEQLDESFANGSLSKKQNKEEIVRYRPLNLPLARIKQIIKMDPDVNLAASDAVFLIAKATELFIEYLSKDAYTITVSSKKKTIQKKDVDSAIQNADALVFLDGALDM